ncbi:hypothetical protein LTR50_007380 [Elasticomyces elasticus]|nr:hypothetical protein LTR50_007380 [Elasticomyces elasticus]
MGGTYSSTTTEAPPQPQPSAIQHVINTQSPPDSPHAPHLHHLALQVKHNLEHQHLWTDLRIHTHVSLSPPTTTTTTPSKPTTTPQPLILPLLPRPMLSGLPPQRLYIHPDEQIELLQAQRKKAGPGRGMGDVAPEREWVLPTHLKEKWSLRRFGEVFDGVGVVPGAVEGDGEGEERARARLLGRILPKREGMLGALVTPSMDKVVLRLLGGLYALAD